MRLFPLLLVAAVSSALLLQTAPASVAATAPGPSPAPAVAGAQNLFTESVTPAVFELASGALGVWRQHAGRRPALVLFSTHPFLDPLRDADTAKVAEFVRTAPPTELVRRGRHLTPDPMLLPPQTVSAAIAAGLISELVYVQPTSKKPADLSLAHFQQRAFDAGFLTADEARALTLENGVISGTLRGIPFRCVHPEALPRISGPVVVHIDLGYFKDLYVNAVKTPAYGLLYELITSIRDAGWPALALTLSYSNQEADFSLESRFMLSTLADIAYRPSLLREGIPASWELRASAQYATDMFAETKARELVAEAARLTPDDPAAQYDLSQVLFRQRRNAEAFAALDRAVELDRGYALAYLELSDTGMELGEGEKSLALLNKAAAAFPDNPFIRISQADRLIRLERGREALRVLNELSRLPWSSTYHPGIPALLEEMTETARIQAAKTP